MTGESFLLSFLTLYDKSPNQTRKKFLSLHDKYNLGVPILSKVFVNQCHQHLCLGTLAPARELPGDTKSSGNAELEAQLMQFLTNPNLIVPVVAALAVIIIAIIVCCVLKGRNNNISKGMHFLRNPCPTFWWNCQQCGDKGRVPWPSGLDWFEYNRSCQRYHHCCLCWYSCCLCGSFQEERPTHDESRLNKK